MPLSFDLDLAETAVTCTGRPARAAINAPLRPIVLSTPAPTVPRPATPIETGSANAGPSNSDLHRYLINFPG